MVQHNRIGKIMVDAADTSNLPLTIGFSVARDGNVLKLKSKDVEFTPHIVEYILRDVKNVRCVGVMHSNINVISEALSVIENVWDGATIAYPDYGTFDNNIWRSEATEEVKENIVQSMLQLKKKHPNLHVVGGCCGLGPLFIKKLKNAFEPYLHRS